MDYAATVSFVGGLSFLFRSRDQCWNRLTKFGLTNNILSRNKTMVTNRLTIVKATQGASSRPWIEIVPVPPGPVVNVLLSAEIGFHTFNHCIHRNQRGLP